MDSEIREWNLILPVVISAVAFELCQLSGAFPHHRPCLLRRGALLSNQHPSLSCSTSAIVWIPLACIGNRSGFNLRSFPDRKRGTLVVGNHVDGYILPPLKLYPTFIQKSHYFTSQSHELAFWFLSLSTSFATLHRLCAGCRHVTHSFAMCGIVEEMESIFVSHIKGSSLSSFSYLKRSKESESDSIPSRINAANATQSAKAWEQIRGF